MTLPRTLRQKFANGFKFGFTETRRQNSHGLNFDFTETPQLKIPTNGFKFDLPTAAKNSHKRLEFLALAENSQPKILANGFKFGFTETPAKNSHKQLEF
ncbi:MAG: hypothetical protein ACLTK0_06825 [Anaerovoracaceae bacterium]